MKSIAPLALVACLALAASGVALAGDDCGMNSNKPCPPPEKLSTKEPANRSTDDKTVARRTDTTPARAEVQANDDDETAARATLTGITAEDLKIKPKRPCNLNSNTPCTEQGEAAEPGIDADD